MFDEKSFNYILFGLLTVYTLYIVMKNNEPFFNINKKSIECSDKAINTQIFDYVLSELNQTKAPN